MLRDCVGNGDIEGAVLKGQRRGVALQKINIRRFFPGKRNKTAVPINAAYSSMGIPSPEGLRQSARTAPDFKHTAFFINFKSFHISFLEVVRKSQRT